MAQIPATDKVLLDYTEAISEYLRMRHLDETDLQILRELQQNGRISNAELAKTIGLSPPSVLHRVRALEKAGFVRDYIAVLDPEKLGMKITAWAMISLSLHQDQPIERFRRQILEIEEVVECYHVSGDFDFLAKVLVRDIRSYEALVREKLSKIRGVGKINSAFVYGVPKAGGKLPF